MTDDCRVTALDVGQGQCILLQAEGKTYMVDCGGNFGSAAADKAAATLLSQGISRLDGIIVTHYDEDHTAGIPLLLSRIRADMIFLPASPDNDGVADAIENATDGKLLYVDEDMAVTFGEAKLTIFGPLSGQIGNESSMCVLFQAADCDILITGDRSDFGERMLLREVQLPKLEVLVVGHHGSNSSTGDTLLETTKPEIALISVGKWNGFGHPHTDVLNRLERHGCRVYRTDTMGTLTFRR
jgi:competence protein ComEC